MTYNINNMTPSSGRIVTEEGTVVNEANIIDGGKSASVWVTSSGIASGDVVPASYVTGVVSGSTITVTLRGTPIRQTTIRTPVNIVISFISACTINQDGSIENDGTVEGKMSLLANEIGTFTPSCNAVQITGTVTSGQLEILLEEGGR